MTSDLRSLLAHQMHHLSQSNRHVDLPGICNELGLVPPPEDGSKAERMQAAFGLVGDADLPALAKQILANFPPIPKERNDIEELLWVDASAPDIPKRYRRELARALSVGDLYLDAARFDALLDRLWVLDDDSFVSLLSGVDRSLRARINRHVHRNPGDWSPEELFNFLGAYDCTNLRFVRFVEGLACADVRPDETNQRRFVEIVNDALRDCGVELREIGEDGGYPVFSMVSLAIGNRGRPKNLIFASPVKPDLRFRDAVNNDIEIVTNAEKVLVYDRPIGADGLKWQDLQRWWAETNGIEDAKKAKESLYRRLQSCLSDESPPQKRLFRSFFEGFGSDIPTLPALLPEVWLHWDPKTVKERGLQALARFRMDFLLLLPANIRVVVEVDGKHHYTDTDGRASVTKYAAMVAADRELRLAGYDVYRFGAAELQDGDASRSVAAFFRALFKKHGVVV